MIPADPDRVRGEILDAWERMAPRWGAHADTIRAPWMPVSRWLIDALSLQPGQRVLELAAGPGDTGFLAAELVAPDGLLISSDAVEAMVDVARERAARFRVRNVEFKQLSLEWIDLPTADVDAIVCRWGIMLAIDPGAALREARRVLRPGGSIALSAWDVPERNPWMTIPRQALIEAGLLQAPDPALPGPFALSRPGLLGELLADAGFTDVDVEALDLERRFDDAAGYLADTVSLAEAVASCWQGLSDEQRGDVTARVAELAEPFGGPGGLVLPARTLVARAEG